MSLIYCIQWMWTGHVIWNKGTAQSMSKEVAWNGMECHEANALITNGTVMRGRVGLVLRALAFHQCGPRSISALGVICGLSLLVLYSVMRGFSPGSPVFPSHQKPTFDLIWFVNNNCKIVISAMLIWFPLELQSAFDHVHMLICAIEILNIIIIIIMSQKGYSQNLIECPSRLSFSGYG